MSYSYHIVHASPSECDVLDQLQQFTQLWDGNPGVRIYTNGLEKAFENPTFFRSFLDYARQNYAKGGRVGIERMTPDEIEEARAAGRFGDTCLAIIGPRTRAAMDWLSPTAGSTNKVTGYPEYFDLSGLFNGIGSGLSSIGSGLWNGIKGIGGSLLGGASQALPGVMNTLGTMGGGALGNMFGGPAGGAMGSQLGGSLGNMLGGMGGKIFDQFGQALSPQGAQSPQASAMGQGMQNFAQNMAGGQGFGQSARNAFQGASPYMFGNSPMGQGMQNFAQNMMGGQGFMPSLQNAYQQTGGMGPMMQAGQQALNAYQQGGSPMNAMQQGANYLTQAPQYGPQNAPNSYGPQNPNT